MLCKRFTGIILLALLFAHQVLAVTKRDVASKQKVLVDGTITSVNKKIGVGGRKLMGKQESIREETSLREPINGGGSDYSEISGATTSSDGNFVFEGKGDFSVKCKNICSEKAVLGRFVAFSADYHGPKHHPPKHN